MAKVYSKALDQTLEVDRYIGRLEGTLPGPSVVFTAGMHGNEPSGVFALRRMLDWLQANAVPLRGKVYALAGNLWALQRQERYHRQDLNRLWTVGRIQRLQQGQLLAEDEDARQQQALWGCLQQILQQDKGPFYFMDLHTTSCETIPFLLLNDSLLNRRFTAQYPLPMILGIEEYLEGPLLSYINELGYVAFGFEAGQHDDLSSIENHQAFSMLSLVFAGCLKGGDIPFAHYWGILAKHTRGVSDFWEIFFRYRIREGEQFAMVPGYVNFQKVHKGQQLASSNGRPIRADRTARVFMPLYQSQGSEGFFAIRKVAPVFLRLSAAMRRLGMDKLLPLLPGIRWIGPARDALRVDHRLARLYSRDLFHLLGYRSKRLKGRPVGSGRPAGRAHYILRNREAASRDAEYREADWY
ncbi:succinylglutamate desuccinylase/aspartoacylase family protein [Cesiribacter andamanensis]|uniref:Succinylglutamate desuccinylase n=1 Tax=Cesiribacter andamanensis AMV16 TaxID=1279009 RepID=M7N2P9_9BACT|nr:succinylglutamate desuccinylase/aspartoacylase family protein [Cesiribacter andamanensis]EMR01496.1 Succinylglutamate desuccinylase [Cesiribacter andamanensis AMV16]